MNLRLVASCCLVSAVLVVSRLRRRPSESPGRQRSRGQRRAGLRGTGFRREQDIGAHARRSGTRRSTGRTSTPTTSLSTSEACSSATHRAFGRSGTSWWSITDYTFVLTEVAGEVQPVVIEIPEHPQRLRKSPRCTPRAGLPAMDLYLEGPGVGIAGATRPRHLQCPRSKSQLARCRAASTSFG